MKNNFFRPLELLYARERERERERFCLVAEEKIYSEAPSELCSPVFCSTRYCKRLFYADVFKRVFDESFGVTYGGVWVL